MGKLFRLIVCLVIWLSVLGIGIFFLGENTTKIQKEYYGMPMIFGNTILPISPMNFPLTQVLGSIISCESGGIHTAKNPDSTAYGLCQFIDSTWNYAQKKWDIKLDRYDYNDQLYACERLYREEGDKHWLESKHCWNK